MKHGTTKFSFQQVDVFSSRALLGNPLAVVIGADTLTASEMAAFASWTNLSETTFLLQPKSADADYRVRIFTPVSELPFAGHPTLGSCHVWLSSGGRPKSGDIIQECNAGLIRIRRDNERLSFEAPELRRSGPVELDTLTRAIEGLRLTSDVIVDANWASLMAARCFGPEPCCSWTNSNPSRRQTSAVRSMSRAKNDAKHG